MVSPGRFRDSGSHSLSLVNNCDGKKRMVVNGTSNREECWAISLIRDCDDHISDHYLLQAVWVYPGSYWIQ